MHCRPYDWTCELRSACIQPAGPLWVPGRGCGPVSPALAFTITRKHVLRCRGGLVSKRYHQAILVSCEVPWDDREQLLEDAFRQQVRETLARGLNNLYIFGTAGE